MLKIGYIYKIIQNCDENKINYIGSTFRNPRIRYNEHKRWSKYNLWNTSSCKVLFNEIYDLPPIMEILEEIEFNSNDEKKNKKILRKLEFFHIQNTKNNINIIKKLGNPNNWYGKNKEIIEENRKKRVIQCECGCNVNYYYYHKHLQTKKHKIYLELIENKNKIKQLEKTNYN